MHPSLKLREDLFLIMTAILDDDERNGPAIIQTVFNRAMRWYSSEALGEEIERLAS